MITIESLHKSFGTQVVLDGVSFTVNEGDTLAVVGPSGAGKSVLIKIILGILKPDSGRVLIDRQDITSLTSEREINELRSSLGMLFQSAALFDSLTVYENVAFPLTATRRMSPKKAYDRVFRVLEALSLDGYSLCYPQEISMGTRKRVGLARALVTEPRVVLFDEPNTGLDPLVGQEVYDLIKESKERWGFTGIVISHEIPEVFQISDKVIMLLNGKVAFNGTPKEVIASDNAAVQQFLGGHTHGPIRLQ